MTLLLTIQRFVGCCGGCLSCRPLKEEDKQTDSNQPDYSNNANHKLLLCDVMKIAQLKVDAIYFSNTLMADLLN